VLYKPILKTPWSPKVSRYRKNIAATKTLQMNQSPYSPLFGKHLRLEHYDVAARHGEIAGANMAGAQERFNDVPHYFSSMFKLRIEAGEIQHSETRSSDAVSLTSTTRAGKSTST
jgi:hypothetical protein